MVQSVYEGATIRKFWLYLAMSLASVTVLGGTSASTASEFSGPAQAPRSPEALPVSEASRAPETPPPNVVLLVLDDAAAADIAYMPNVQTRLVDRGTTFARYYSPWPLCCPARASILTGRYPHNHQVIGNLGPLGGFTAFEDDQTIATWLNPTYRTGFVGKYFNDYADTAAGRRYVPPGWDSWRASVEPSTYAYLHQRLNIDGTLTRFDGYATTTFGEMGREFLESDGESPFFLYQSFVAPHNGGPREPDDPSIGSPHVEAKYVDTYVGPTVSTDPSFNEADVSDKPADVRSRPLLSAEQIAEIGEQTSQRRESLRSVDNQISFIINAVKRQGQIDNTYFILLSDNGFFAGEHRIATGKHLAYEPAAKVPLIIRGPGIEAGASFDGLAGHQDIAPTILDMTDQSRDPAAPPLDGLSLLGLLDASSGSDRVMLLERAQVDPYSDVRIARTDVESDLSTVTWITHGMVTPDGWKYLEYPRTAEVEMYNLNSDPSEETNVADRPRWAAKQSELRDLLLQYKECRGASCR
ncbi:MAG: sulfatase-like hydrolase/transferase [Nocardioidaceae bacterium]|nr:sulfatase-like hydrolase/transferase [Nocardioidaceae bacterium]